MIKTARAVSVVSAFFLSFTAFSAFADSKFECFSNKLNRHIDVDNQQVLNWKSRSQYRDRARVSGVVSRVTQQRKTHTHFEVKIGPNARDTVEIVYNVEFGRLPKLEAGMAVEACGDYINVGKQSPSGAIIHWVHYNPGDRDGGKHEHGYVNVSGEFFGHINPKLSAH